MDGASYDQVFAGSSNDNIKGDAGDDLLDGGTDVDTAVYAGSSGSYTVGFNNVQANGVSAASVNVATPWRASSS